MAGFETIYGDEMVNVSLFDVEKQEQKLFFEKPVLIENVYYPSATRDTLQNKNVNRNFYMISCYDEDTDKDGYYTPRWFYVGFTSISWTALGWKSSFLKNTGS